MKVIGHQAVQRYLERGLEEGDVSPSLLFVGPEGVGKRTLALEFAKFFFCSSNHNKFSFTRDCACALCHKVDSNSQPDLLILNFGFQAALLREKEEAQNSIRIESIRHLEKFLQLRPFEGRKRVAIIEEAEKMTIEAANALLKILEEPPAIAQIVLIAQNLQNFPPTIPSRCAVLRFSTLNEKEISHWLVASGKIEKGKADLIAGEAGGSLRKAVEIANEEPEEVDISSFGLDEFFDWLQEPSWKKEGKVRAAKFVNHLIGAEEKRLAHGDWQRATSLEYLLSAQEELAKHVPPKIVLENLFLKLTAPFAERKN